MGISCIRPCAPAALTAFGSSPDSLRATDASSAAETLYREPAAAKRSAYFPSPAEELEIIRLKVPEVPEKLARAVVAAVQKIRAMDLRKLPSVSESLDWARSLVILNARELSPELVESTLTMLVKHEKDLERVKGALDKVLAD